MVIGCVLRTAGSFLYLKLWVSASFVRSTQLPFILFMAQKSKSSRGLTWDERRRRDLLVLVFRLWKYRKSSLFYPSSNISSLMRTLSIPISKSAVLKRSQPTLQLYILSSSICISKLVLCFFLLLSIDVKDKSLAKLFSRLSPYPRF